MPTPSHDELLTDLLSSRLDIDGLIERHNLSPAQLRAFAQDPVVAETLRLYEDLRARRQRILTEERQTVAAEHLHNAILDAHGPEIRRTAAALTAVCRVSRPRNRPSENDTEPPTPVPADPLPHNPHARTLEAVRSGTSPKKRPEIPNPLPSLEPVPAPTGATATVRLRGGLVLPPNPA